MKPPTKHLSRAVLEADVITVVHYIILNCGEKKIKYLK